MPITKATPLFLRYRLKGFVFLTLLLVQGVFTACAPAVPVNNKSVSAVQPEDKQALKPDPALGEYTSDLKFNTNFIPKKDDPFRPFYDLSFTLQFQDPYTATYGTGWLIDWKDNNQPNKFTAYIATNLHVADNLRNVNDYEFFNQFDYFDDPTESFTLGKFVDGNEIKQIVPDAMHEPSLVRIETSKLPKTAYTATLFINDLGEYRLPAADFAVLESI
ncbi:DUF31 family putative serine protease [Mycoplasmoides pneumoniae]|uniref:DUF31 domain-containing protein n=2 Tax=Mycoplasmoides pneumoniae TaxID=2104 RepID=A0A0H3DLT9_MYCPB|nr:hypothetical protein [Mycoplasmoides pneumoniae]ADK87261.1 conserved hypothetical protein [Mycoplasmoides pneumoniae FH]QHR08337.1 hypothetical protein FA925_03395 [Mycoplasmoides pneumoniae]QHR10437.1 hypothetical protein FA928_03385 [Mycoplasmoides pneumoniae]QHR13237.1 hypothetical protein FA932_03395 [Mycoplasmoides pneumoniae]QHR14636.1 hypothetical protein FA934_03420 [Mycoplasmoides pneumoniae]